MVRGTKGTHASRDGAQVEASDRMNERRLYALVLVEWRQNARQPLGKHALTRTWRPDEQRPVPTCRSDGESAHGELLTDHVTIVELLVILCRRKRIRRRERSRAQLCEMIDARMVEPRKPWHARRIRSREQSQVVMLGCDGVGEQAIDTTHGTIEGKLPHRQGLLDEARIYLASGKEICNRDRQVETRPALAYVGRREVDDDVSVRHIEAGSPHGAAHTQTSLLNGSIGHANDVPARQARPNLDLDRDGHGLHAIERARGNGGAYGLRGTH